MTNPLFHAEPESGSRSKERVRSAFEFSMSVTRIHEDPRVTKPYSDEQWIEIESLGHQVDADLKAHDVRLTMGGEPTFVSIDDMDGAEWNTDAVGPTKYKRADMLIRRLRDRFATGGFLHHGMGKWYPGESLPRWALGLYWRKDGEPIWRDPTLVADENVPAKLTSYDARVFILKLAERLDVNPAHVLPGYEDAWYYLWKERRLPVNVDPFESKLDNAEDRARLARVFEQGLDEVVGYALPLRREHYTDGTSEWESGAWLFRPERMYLVPGDSPMGFRLPLDSIPWVKESEYPHLHEQDPMADRLSRCPTAQHMARQQQYVAENLALSSAGIRGANSGIGPRPSEISPPDHGPGPASGAGTIGVLAHPHRALHGSARRHLARVHAAAENFGGLSRAGRGN